MATDPTARGDHTARPDALHETEREPRYADPREAAAEGQHRGANIALNDALFADDPARREQHAAIVAEIAREGAGRSEDDIERIARDRLADADVELSDVEVDRLVEQIVRARGITHVTSDHGGVLEGRGDAHSLRNDAGPANPAVDRSGRRPTD